MSSAIDCCNVCPTVQTLNIPGPQGEQGEPGADGANALIAPGALNPEGNVIGIPGQTYLNTTDDSFWIKKSGIDAFGWINLIGGAAIMLLCLFLSTVSANAQAVLRTYFTTNTTPTVSASITNTALVSQTNNYSWSSNNIVAITTTNATILSFYTNLVRYVSTNAGGVVVTFNTNLARFIATNDAAVLTAMTNAAKSEHAGGSFTMATGSVVVATSASTNLMNAWSYSTTFGAVGIETNANFVVTNAGSYLISFGSYLGGANTDVIRLMVFTNGVECTLAAVGISATTQVPSETGFKEYVVTLPANCRVSLRVSNSNAANTTLQNSCFNLRLTN